MRASWRVVPALALLFLAAGCGGKLVSRGSELQMGQEADRVIVRRYHVSDDEQTQWLVQRIGRQVAAQSNRPEIPFTFRVLEEREINAFSVPGYVYVNRGLIRLANADPDALAAVIAHEIAHTTQRHMAKQIERVYGASFLLNMIARGRGTVDTLAQVAAELALNGNSREDERDADAWGMRFMTRAGYNPWAMPRFFDQLRKATGDVKGLNRYFSDHPTSAERIRRCQEIILKEHLAPAPPDFQPAPAAQPGPGSKRRE